MTKHLLEFVETVRILVLIVVVNFIIIIIVNDFAKAYYNKYLPLEQLGKW